ncbi:MAG: hypothetical protein ACPL4K_06835, partial [Candidatus Margulisiibacteriota bacterium]
MSKRALFGLLGLIVVGTLGISFFGCGKLVEEVKRLDPGILTQEVTAISGSVSYSGGVCDVNLAAIVVSGEALTLEAKNFS